MLCTLWQATAPRLEEKLGPLAVPHSVAGLLHPYYVDRYKSCTQFHGWSDLLFLDDLHHVSWEWYDSWCLIAATSLVQAVKLFIGPETIHAAWQVRDHSMHFCYLLTHPFRHYPLQRMSGLVFVSSFCFAWIHGACFCLWRFWTSNDAWVQVWLWPILVTLR